jgi:hypothetical protein
MPVGQFLADQACGIQDAGSSDGEDESTGPKAVGLQPDGGVGIKDEVGSEGENIVDETEVPPVDGRGDVDNIDKTEEAPVDGRDDEDEGEADRAGGSEHVSAVPLKRARSSLALPSSKSSPKPSSKWDLE